MSIVITTSNVRQISHAWMDARDRVDVQTAINGYEWPVPILKDTSLDLIRIEMLNMRVEYTWLDVLCLRQKGGRRDELREKEWKLDVPTIGAVYEVNGGGLPEWVRAATLIILQVALLQPLNEGDLESDRCWFRRVWTLQEIGRRRDHCRRYAGWTAEYQAER